jgi:ribosome-associated protein
MDEGRWVLLDYGDVMVHVFQEPVRDFYDLDGLWSEAPEIRVPAAEGA